MKNYYVYKVEDFETGQFYIGSRGCICNPEEDVKYFGSMSVWKPNKAKLIKTILFNNFNTREDALNKEADLIKENIDNPLNRNYHIPNKGYHVNGMMTAIDRDGNTLSVPMNDIRLKTGELVSINKGKINVKDKYGNKFKVSINDERYLSGELIPNIKVGKVAVKDKNGNKFMIDKFDERYLNGELVSINKGKTIVKDSYNNIFFVNVDDYRLKNGEISGIHKGTTPWNKGIPMTEEQKAKLRKPKTEEHKKKLSEARLKIKTKRIICITNNIVYDSMKLAASELNLTIPNIVNVLKGRAKSTKGFTFCYFE